MKTIEDIPVLSTQSFTGHAGEFRKTRGAIFVRLANELGDIGRIYFFNVPIVVLCAPELIHEVLVEKHKSFVKSYGTRIMFYPFAGNGLFTSEGESWKRQRKLLSPLFHPGVIKSYAEVMNDVIRRCLDGWKDGAIIDATREMTRITMAVAAKVMFDADTLSESDELSAAIRRMFDYLADQSGSLSLVVRASLAGALFELGQLPMPLERAREAAIERLHRLVPLPTKKRRDLLEAIRTLDDRIQRMIDERRARGSAGRDDLLSRLLAARDEDDGSFMNDRQVRDEAMTLFIAGHDTTATSTTWSLYFLSRSPEARARWLAEIDGLSGKTPTADDAAKLTWTRGVFREALRLRPPAFVVDRVAQEDVEIGGYLFKRGTPIIVPVHAIHHREKYWPDPERFDPSRFHPEAEAKRPKGLFLGFGAGPRVCIGAAFAELEAELLFAQIAQRFELEPLDTAPIEPDFTAFLKPERPVLLRVRDKRAARSSRSPNAADPERPSAAER